MRTWDRGDRLVSPEALEERREAEKEARLARFGQGAAHISRASGGVVTPDGEWVGRTPRDDDELARAFAELNQRFSE